MMNDEKILSRLSSWKEQQGGEASFRVLYYGGAAGSVPFLWESQPGTPKHPLGDGPLPPLTPPPQHHSLIANPSLKKKKKHSKIFNSIFSKKSSTPPSPCSSSYSSTPSTPFDDGEEDGYGYGYGYGYGEGRVSPTSTLCFRGKRSKGHPIKGINVKKVVKSIAGRRHF